MVGRLIRVYLMGLNETKLRHHSSRHPKVLPFSQWEELDGQIGS